MGFMTTVYLLFCALGGFAYFFLKWAFLCSCCGDGEKQRESEIYYVTGRYWRNIVKATWLLGIAFGTKLGLTNYGLDLVSVDYHVLFAATALGWVAVIGWLLLKERPSLLVWLLVVMMSCGQLLLSWQFESEKQFTVLGLAVNLMTPALQGICVVLMRYSSLLLFPEWMTKNKSRAGGLGLNPRRPQSEQDEEAKANNSFRILNLSCIMKEFNQGFAFNVDTLVAYTTVKLLFSFLTALPMALIMDGFLAEVPFWEAIAKSNFEAIGSQLLLGAVVTFFLQASLVLLSMLSLALTLGVLSVVKVLPQLICGILLSSKTFEATAMHIVGIALILGSSPGYIIAKIKHSGK